MKILLTGFEPFGESPINPSHMLVDSLSHSSFRDAQIITAILPVDHEKAPVVLMNVLDINQPDAILCFGLAMGRAKISLERVAINLMDFRMPDNAGHQISDRPIIPDGPAAYFSTLPVRQFYDALRENDIPVELSLTAGSYLCNQVFCFLGRNTCL